MKEKYEKEENKNRTVTVRLFVVNFAAPRMCL